MYHSGAVLPGVVGQPCVMAATVQYLQIEYVSGARCGAEQPGHSEELTVQQHRCSSLLEHLRSNRDSHGTLACIKHLMHLSANQVSGEATPDRSDCRLQSRGRAQGQWRARANTQMDNLVLTSVSNQYRRVQADDGRGWCSRSRRCSHGHPPGTLLGNCPTQSTSAVPPACAILHRLNAARICSGTLRALRARSDASASVVVISITSSTCYGSCCQRLYRGRRSGPRWNGRQGEGWGRRQLQGRGQSKGLGKGRVKVYVMCTLASLANSLTAP